MAMQDYPHNRIVEGGLAVSRAGPASSRQDFGNQVTKAAGRTWSTSSILLFFFGTILVFVGAYFIVIRPALLPEDLRYLGASQAQIEIAAPRLAAWLGHVFLVLGGYIAATGILTMALAATAYREHRRTAAIAALLGGAASIGLMTAVNFAIASDFKWVLSGIAALWACSIACYGIEILRGRGARSRTEDDHATGLSGGLLGYERKYSRAVTLDASADEVFAFADDFTRLSSHMGQSSAMMMGSSMQTSFDERRGQAVGSHVRMTGKMLGIELFLDEVVREREPPRHKAWETVGTPRLLIIGGYRLGFDITSIGQRSVLQVFIGYNLPTEPAQRLLGRLFGGLCEMVRQADGGWRGRKLSGAARRVAEGVIRQFHRGSEGRIGEADHETWREPILSAQVRHRVRKSRVHESLLLDGRTDHSAMRYGCA